MGSACSCYNLPGMRRFLPFVLLVVLVGQTSGVLAAELCESDCGQSGDPCLCTCLDGCCRLVPYEHVESAAVPFWGAPSILAESIPGSCPCLVSREIFHVPRSCSV